MLKNDPLIFFFYIFLCNNFFLDIDIFVNYESPLVSPNSQTPTQTNVVACLNLNQLDQSRKPSYFIAFLCDNFPKSTFDNTKKFPSHTYLEKLDPIKPSKIPSLEKIPTSGHTFLPPCYQIAKSLLSDFSSQIKCQNLYEAAKYIINNN